MPGLLHARETLAPIADAPSPPPSPPPGASALERLRRKLSAGNAADHIVTLRGMGYRFDPTPECESTSGGPESA